MVVTDGLAGMYLWLQRDGDQKAFSVWVWPPGYVYPTFWGVHKALPVQLLWNHPWAREQGSQAQQLLIKGIVPRTAITTQKIPLSISSGISCFCNADVSKRFICGHLLITFTSVYCFRWAGQEADTRYWPGQHPVITWLPQLSLTTLFYFLSATNSTGDRPVTFSLGMLWTEHTQKWCKGWVSVWFFQCSDSACSHSPWLWGWSTFRSERELIAFHSYRITNNLKGERWTQGPPLYIAYSSPLPKTKISVLYFKFRKKALSF